MKKRVQGIPQTWMCSLCQLLTTLVSKTSCQYEQLDPLGRKTGVLYLIMLALTPHS